MKTLAFFGDEPFRRGIPLEVVKAPEHDKTATCFAFDAPYRRVRFDKDTRTFYVLRNGKRVDVMIMTVGYEQ